MLIGEMKQTSMQTSIFQCPSSSHFRGSQLRSFCLFRGFFSGLFRIRLCEGSLWQSVSESCIIVRRIGDPWIMIVVCVLWFRLLHTMQLFSIWDPWNVTGSCWCLFRIGIFQFQALNCSPKWCSTFVVCVQSVRLNHSKIRECISDNLEQTNNLL